MNEELKQAALNLCYEIEKLPASEQQTKISIMASDLHHKIDSRPTPTPEVGSWENNFDILVANGATTNCLKDFIRSHLAAKTGGEQGIRVLEEEVFQFFAYMRIDSLGQKLIDVVDSDKLKDGIKSFCAHFARPVVSRHELAEAMWSRQPYMRYDQNEMQEWAGAVIHHLLEGRKG